MERVKTGIKGFDKLVQGGFPFGSSILLSGTPGTGKTIFGIQYIFNGASKYGDKGLYVTFEESQHNLFEQSKQFNWDLKRYIEMQKIKIMSIPAEEINTNTVNDIIDYVKKNRIKRVVIDSIPTLVANSPFPTNSNYEGTTSRFIYTFIERIKKNKDTTNILISHTEDDKSLSKDKISEFVCDGVVHIIYESMGGELSRSLLVRKMRRTKNDEDIHPLQINKEGIKVHEIK